jgi:hypothetical protein
MSWRRNWNRSSRQPYIRWCARTLKPAPRLYDRGSIANLIDESREGRALKALFHKLERIRTQRGSNEVFDAVGWLFQNVSLKIYMRARLAGELVPSQGIEDWAQPAERDALLLQAYGTREPVVAQVGVERGFLRRQPVESREVGSLLGGPQRPVRQQRRAVHE